MSTFVLWIVITMAVEVILAVLFLAGVISPVRTPLSVATQVFSNSVWIGWGIYLLSRESA